MNWYYIIIGAASFQGLLLAIALKKVSNNKKSLNWLSALLIAISVCLVGRIFYDAHLFPKYPKIALASDLILFTYGPLVFWYVKSVFFSEDEKKARVFRHFILAILHLIWLCQFFLVSNAELFRLLFTKLHQAIGHLTEIFGWIHISVYLIAAYSEFKKYPEKAKAVISNLPTIHFLRYFFTLNAIALLLWAIGFLLLRFHGSAVSILLTYNSIWIILTCSVYMTGYYAIVFPQVFRIKLVDIISPIKIDSDNNAANKKTFVHQKEITNEKSIVTVFKETATEISESVTIETRESKKETTVTVSVKAAVNDTQVLEFANKLEFFMDKERPYLDPNLTLPMLSGKLSCSVHLLSKVINESFGKNFFDYINGYRIDYFIQLAQKPSSEQYTILAMAFESGFNSKSTFNNSFKKATGKTPSQVISDLSINKRNAE